MGSKNENRDQCEREEREKGNEIRHHKLTDSTPHKAA